MMLNSPLNSWLKEERPREKFALKGSGSLTDSELLAILLGKGSRSKTALDLSREILACVNNDLHQFSRLTIEDMCKFKGVGEAKAITILAALELGKRKRKQEVLNDKISSSESAFHYFESHLQDLSMEEFHVLCLARNNSIIKSIRIASGGISGVFVDVKLLFKYVLDTMCSSIILAHNHPSGNKQPSIEDKLLTKKIYDAGKILDINVLDHIIVINNGYFSFADEGLMNY